MALLLVGYASSTWLESGQIKGLLKHSTVWLEVGAYLGIALSITAVKSPNQSLLMAASNAICAGLLFTFSMLASLFRASKHYKTDNLTHRRPALYCSLSNFGNLILLIILSVKYDCSKGTNPLRGSEMAIYCLVFLLLTLLKISKCGLR